jgi:hypothetical protein
MKQTAVEWLIDESMKLVVQYMNGTLNEDTLDDVIYEIGTKAKEMEKEQMCSFAEFVATYPDKNKNVNGEMLHAKSKYDGAERTVDLLEIFKSE